MPFREIDDEAGRLAHWPREVRSWLRRIIVEDWNLKLLALAITLGLWFGVTGQRAPATIRLRGVQLNFQLPANMEISNDPRDEVEVTLTGSKRDLDGLNVRDLVANVDVSSMRPGERVVQLIPERVVKMELPEGVRIDDIEPNTVPLRLEPRVEREIEVEARLEGNLPDGYELRAVNITPHKVVVRGPASHINDLQKALTETIPLEGRKESFTFPQTAIDIPDPKVDVINPVVDITLEIGELRVEKSFARVTVHESSGAQARPETASVTVYGARSVIESLRAENMQIMLDVSGDGAITPRLILPSDLQGRVELRSTKPAGFTIIR
ncbi:MAG TPA: CdaR family protein [Pyrinomonadaceae bacterium]|jgi:YbbR domain-containing protein